MCVLVSLTVVGVDPLLADLSWLVVFDMICIHNKFLLLGNIQCSTYVISVLLILVSCLGLIS